MIEGVLNVGGEVAFTVVGAVAVSALTAFVTARTTNQRLDKQLRAEGERADAQLTAEKERQVEQLRHERELNDLAELRSLLDETSRLISRVVKTSAQVATNWNRRTESDEFRERLESLRQSLRNEVVEIVECHQRIMLRLPRDSDVSNALNDVRVSIGKLARLSGDAPITSEGDAQYMANGLGDVKVAEAHVTFLDASRELVGAKLPS
jgi:predicted RNase H-like nuclease (RuvC/YqgF family)